MSSPESLPRSRTSNRSSSLSDDDEPLRKITLEVVEATFPPNYKKVIGEVVIIDKTGDENEEIDMESAPEEITILDKTDKESKENEKIDLEQLSDNSKMITYDSSSEETDPEDLARSDHRKTKDMKDDSEELFDGNFADIFDGDFEEHSDDVENPEENMIVNDDNGDDDDDDDDNDNDNDNDDDSGVQEYVEGLSSEDIIKLRAEYAKKLQALVKKHQTEQALSTSEKRMTFSKTERSIIIYYLIANNKIANAKGRDIWKYFTDDGYLPNRTHTSIWNHIMQHLIPSIDSIVMPKVFKREFLKLQVKKTRNRTKTNMRIKH